MKKRKPYIVLKCNQPDDSGTVRQTVEYVTTLDVVHAFYKFLIGIGFDPQQVAQSFIDVAIAWAPNPERLKKDE